MEARYAPGSEVCARRRARPHAVARSLSLSLSLYAPEAVLDRMLSAAEGVGEGSGWGDVVCGCWGDG